MSTKFELNLANIEAPKDLSSSTKSPKDRGLSQYSKEDLRDLTADEPLRKQVSYVDSSVGSPGTVGSRKRGVTFAQKKAKSAFSLNPFEKFVRYRTVPCKFLLNVTLFALVCTQIFAFQLERAVRDYEHEREIAELFLPEEYERPGASYQMYQYLPTYKIRTLKTMKRHLNRSIENYYSLVQQSPGYTSFYAEVQPILVNSSTQPSFDSDSRAEESDWSGDMRTSFEIKKPLMSINVRPDNVRFHSSLTVRPDLTAIQFFVDQRGPLIVLDSTDQKFTGGVKSDTKTTATYTGTLCVPRKEAFSDDIFAPCTPQMAKSSPTVMDFYRDRMTEINVEMSFRTLRIDDPVTRAAADYHWNIQQRFNFQISGLCILTVRVKGTLTRTVQKLSIGIGVGIAILVFATWDIVLRIRVVLRFRKFKETHAYLFDKKKSKQSTEAEWLAFDLQEMGKKSPRGSPTSRSPNRSPPASSSPELNVKDEVVAVHVEEKRSGRFSGADEEELLSESSSDSDDADAVDLNATQAGGSMSLGTFSAENSSPHFASGTFSSPLLANGSPVGLQAAKKKRRKREKKVNKNTLGGHWIAWAIAADLLSIAATLMNLIQLLAVDENEAFILFRNVAIGSSAFMLCTLFISYFRHVPKFYFLMEAMAHALPKIGVFGVNVLPLFFGYSFFGLCVFGPYAAIFQTWEYTLVVLFALVGGDSPLFTFLQVADIHGFWMQTLARLYVGTFVVLMLVCCLNVALAIVQDSYYHIKRKLRVLNQPDNEEEKPDQSTSTLDSLIPRDGDSHVFSREESTVGSFTSSTSLANHQIRNGARVLTTGDVERAIQDLMYMLEALPNDEHDETSR